MFDAILRHSACCSVEKRDDGMMKWGVEMKREWTGTK
jgi:hypothetical protein